MPSLLPARWSRSETRSAPVDPVLYDDIDDLAIGFEAACPALQLEGWDAPEGSVPRHEPSLN